MFTKQFENYNFPLLGLVRLPEVNIPDKDKVQLGLSKDSSNCDYLCALTYKNFQEKKHKLNPEKLKEYEERMKYELDIFEELGFTDYILLVYLVINKLREIGGFVDFGRGSNAGSFVSGLLGTTGVLDVIDKGLLFERFVSRVRSKKQIINGITYIQGDLAPDCDLNMGDKRPEILEWLKTLYNGKICKISAFSSLTGKILVKDVYKTVNEINEDEAKRIADLLEKHSGVITDIEEMGEKNEDFKEWTNSVPKTFQCALELRDLLRQSTSHPSGYFISYNNLDGNIPLELNKDKEVTIAYDMVGASKLSIKLDLLGLTLNKILTEFFNDIPEKVEDIELENNPIVYDNLQGDFLPYGLYQISADCAYRVTKKIKPKNILELSDVNAIGRPGALDYLDKYVENKNKSPHKIFDNIIKDNRNLFLYQEDLMRAIVAIGFSLDDAEIVRKIVGKKLRKEFPAWQQKIKDKVKENNLPPEVADIVWKVLIESSGYSFNKCLSPDSIVETENGYKMMHEMKIGDKIKSYDIGENKDIFTKIKNIYENKTELYEIELEDGRKIKSSMNHKYLCNDNKMRTLKEILVNKYKIVTD